MSLQWIKDMQRAGRLRSFEGGGRWGSEEARPSVAHAAANAVAPPLVDGLGDGSDGEDESLFPEPLQPVPVAEQRAQSPSMLDAMAMEHVINTDAELATSAPPPPLRASNAAGKRKQQPTAAGTTTKKPKPRGKAAAPRGANGANKPKPGDVSPWWDASLATTYAQVPHHAPNATHKDAPLRRVNGKQQPKSWFSVKSLPLTHASTGATTAGPIGTGAHIPWRVLMHVDPLDVWSAENGSDRRNAADARDKPLESKPVVQLRCRKTCMRLTRDQKRLLTKWMGAYRFTYNKAVELVNVDRRWKDASCQYLNEQLVFASKNGRTSRDVSTDEKKAASDLKSANMDLKRRSLNVDVGALVREHPWLAEIPTAIRKEACREVAKAVKSNDGIATSKARSGKKHKWKLAYKKRCDDSAWTVAIPVQCLAEAWVEKRPETRRGRTDGAPHKQQGRRDWTRVSMCPTTSLDDVWLAEALPDAALRSWIGGQGKSQRERKTIVKDCRITRDKRGRFYMIVPYEIEATPRTSKPAHERRVGAVDPGDRVQATVYSPSDGEVVSYAIGKHGGGKDRIFAQCAKLDRVVATAAKRKATTGTDQSDRRGLLERIAPLKRERDRVKSDAVLDDVQREATLKRLRVAINAMVAARYRLADGSPADTPSQRRARRRQMAVLRQKGKDLVTEAHRKIALDMVRRWDTLVLPPFNTHDMVQRPKGGARRIHSSVARSLMNWRHYQFKLHTKRLFLREGKEVLLPDEKYTSMTCGSCGILNVKHSKEEWTCRHCSTFHQRDPAAARCILIKAFDRRSSSSSSQGASSSSDNGMVSVNMPSGSFQPTNILDASGRVMGEQR